MPAQKFWVGIFFVKKKFNKGVVRQTIKSTPYYSTMEIR
jgi:hypothetical protein